MLLLDDPVTTLFSTNPMSVVNAQSSVLILVLTVFITHCSYILLSVLLLDLWICWNGIKYNTVHYYENNIISFILRRRGFTIRGSHKKGGSYFEKGGSQKEGSCEPPETLAADLPVIWVFNGGSVVHNQPSIPVWFSQKGGFVRTPEPPEHGPACTCYVVKRLSLFYVIVDFSFVHP